ncbi:MAG: eukaryotic-like serine/threonine-protein kinase [Thermoplasmata archaeon]|nr:eukaryotic-like serine/threonine-protein kinase [Thermoplasmata archaeon]
MTLSGAANALLGAFLLAVAGVVARRGTDRRTRWPLAAYLALVGANYLMDGLRISVVDAGVPGWSQALGPFVEGHYAPRIPLLFDPLALLLFALMTWRPRVSPGLVAAAALPALAIGVAVMLVLPAPTIHAPLWDAFLAELVLYYALAFALLARTYLAARSAAERDRLGTLLVGFGIVLVPRFALLHLDIGLGTYIPFPPGFPSLVTVDLSALVVAFALVAILLLRHASPEARPHVERTTIEMGWMLVVVALAWALFDFLHDAITLTFGLLYSIRWFVFGGFLAYGGRSEGFLGLPGRPTARLRALFTALLAASVLVELVAVAQALPGLAPSVRLLDVLAIAGFGLQVYAVLRLARPRNAAEASWRRAQIYRAQVQLGASEEDLATLQERLGLSAREAGEIRRAVALERDRAAPAPHGALDHGAMLAERYEVGALLGAGSFGLVHEARDRLTGERVVLKELNLRWRADAEALGRFRREIETALRVEHPNLVAFRALESAGDASVLVLAHVEGETLAARLARGPLTPAESAQVARDVLAGLSVLHRHGIVHRDVKPENVMLQPDGRAVLLDFGCATDPVSSGATQAALQPGTPEYMSPEQARGEAVSPASDLYAVGVVLWEALSGARPPGRAPSSPWRVTLLRALDPDPALRWPDAEAFRAALPVA